MATKSRVNPQDLESEARGAQTPEARTALMVRLLATGEWVHGVTAYSLASLWQIGPNDALGLFDAAISHFATAPGSHDAIRGLGFARLSNLADRAMAHRRTVTVERDGEKESYEVPDPQYAVAVKATEAAYQLALGGDAEGKALEAEIERILEGLGLARKPAKP